MEPDVGAMTGLGPQALNALAPLTQRAITEGVSYYQRSSTATTEFKCMVSRLKDRGNHYTPEVRLSEQNL